MSSTVRYLQAVMVAIPLHRPEQGRLIWLPSSAKAKDSGEEEGEAATAGETLSATHVTQ